MTSDPAGAQPDAALLVGLLADADRLRVAAAIVLGAGTAVEIGDVTGLDGPPVHKALERLVSGRLVAVGEDGRFGIDPATFQSAARSAAANKPKGPDPSELGATPEQAQVLRNFVEGNRLVRIPSARAKRLVVLDFLSAQFEPGRVYPEADVNFTLGKWHRDYAALRRYLIDEGFLERRDGFYWRTGGTFEVD
jgi:hypothetical protein